MIVAMTLDRPLKEAQLLVQSSDAFLQEIPRTIEAAKTLFFVVAAPIAFRRVALTFSVATY